MPERDLSPQNAGNWPEDHERRTLARGSSHPLGKPDRQAGRRPHRPPEHPVTRRGCRTFRARGVPVPEFVRTECTDLLPEFRPVITERLLLPGVVPVDHLLDGLLAGHGALPPEQCRRGTQRVPHHVPERQQYCRPDLAGREILGERGEVPPLALGHVPDDRPRRRLAQHGELTLVDALRAVLARVVDPEVSSNLQLRRWIAGEAQRLPSPCRCRVSVTTAAPRRHAETQAPQRPRPPNRSHHRPPCDPYAVREQADRREAAGAGKPPALLDAKIARRKPRRRRLAPLECSHLHRTRCPDDWRRGRSPVLQRFIAFRAGRMEELLNYGSLTGDCSITQPTAQALPSILKISFAASPLPTLHTKLRKLMSASIVPIDKARLQHYCCSHDS